jgi:hypothetical protein
VAGNGLRRPVEGAMRAGDLLWCASEPHLRFGSLAAFSQRSGASRAPYDEVALLTALVCQAVCIVINCTTLINSTTPHTSGLHEGERFA